jgi:hypothetical protein
MLGFNFSVTAQTDVVPLITFMSLNLFNGVPKTIKSVVSGTILVLKIVWVLPK